LFTDNKHSVFVFCHVKYTYGKFHRNFITNHRFLQQQSSICISAIILLNIYINCHSCIGKNSGFENEKLEGERFGKEGRFGERERFGEGRFGEERFGMA
jgi:hypothetical protein